MKKITQEELLKNANKWGDISLRLHKFYNGKMATIPRCAVRSIEDFALWYTPGVAAPCREIESQPEKVYDYTNKGNHIAIISDGTRVLGLGDIGPKAAMPVMEGKALIYKYLGGVDATAICLDTKDPDEFINTVKLLAPSFGGINLEDIANPKCFYILRRLREEMPIPVWHDDQQGTAAVTVAGFINALKVAGKEIQNVRVTLIGAGAANIRIAHLLMQAGVQPEQLIITDSEGILTTEREDMIGDYQEKWELAQKTNPEKRRGGNAEAIKDADVVIALSQSGPGTLDPTLIKTMADNAIVFVCANPVPEIWPWDAHDNGALIVATGRSDFPNQVNNSLCFPGIFRGALDVRASTITDEMCLEASFMLAQIAEENGLRPDYIIPSMDEWDVFPREAAAVGMKAIEQGVAGIQWTYDKLYINAKKTIEHSRKLFEMLQKDGFIQQPEEQ